MSDPREDADKPCECLVVAVTGSVGAMHAPDQIWHLQRTFAQRIHVIMTKSATHFVSANALRLVSAHPVLVDQFDGAGSFSVPQKQASSPA